jgi:hypothetical protein
MVDIKGYLWAFPLFAGILTIVGALTPFSIRNGEYIWLWGLRYYDIKTQPFFEWIFKLQPLEFTIIIFINNLIFFLAFLIISVGSIITSVKIKRKENDTKFEKNVFLWGVSFLIIIVVYLIEFEFLMRIYYKEELNLDASFWEFYYPGFAIIAPFLSAGIIFIAFIKKYFINKRDTIN